WKHLSLLAGLTLTGRHGCFELASVLFKGLPGSCVVIPCSFNYPDPGQTVTKFTGIWTEETSHIIYHPVQSKIVQQYRSRTELLGDITHKNCTLKIDPLQESDQGPFYFRVEIEDFNQFSYKEHSVSISMIEEKMHVVFEAIRPGAFSPE
uniref:B-cell receptor CD22 first Ig-like domain-containing protein n=1 Tax=Scophthalmus maximus TaxID=52904 RepID=A0A8D3CEN8_SCOMX